MKHRKKLSVAALLSVIGILGGISAAYAGEWKTGQSGWQYQEADGSFITGTWTVLDGKSYYFNEYGYMHTGWKEENGRWYYCNPDGSMAVNQWIDGTYYVGKDGAMLTDTVTPDGYRVGPDGVYLPSEVGAADITGLYMDFLTGTKQANLNRGGYYNANYLIRDFNQDGTDDLLLMHHWHDGTDIGRFCRAELYTIRNGEMFLAGCINGTLAPLSYYGFGLSRKNGTYLVSYSKSRYDDYICSITPDLAFIQEVHYTTHGDAGEHGEIYENAGHLYQGYQYATDIDWGERIEVEPLN